MDLFDHRYYRYNKYLIGIVGNWPYQPMKQRKIQWILVYLSIGTVMLVQGLKLAQLWGNIDMMVECIVPMGVQVVALLKASNCISNAVKLRRLLDLMKEDWVSLMDEEETIILMSYARKGFFVGSFYSAWIFGSMTIYLILPLMPQILDVILPLNETRPRQFLYQIEYFVNPNDYYSTIMIHNYVGTLFTIVTIVSVDILLIAYVHHVCGMFTIVGKRLKNAMKDCNVDVVMDQSIESEIIYRRIADCIKDHSVSVMYNVVTFDVRNKHASSKFRRFANLIEASHFMTLLFQVGLSMLLISGTGLHFVTKLGKYREAFRLGQFVIGQLGHLFFNSLPGQMLIDHTQRFRDSVYFAEWYRFPLRGRHLLRLAMLRSLKPCKMTAGKLYDMSMENFGKVVQTSMSYFTVLVSLR